MMERKGQGEAMRHVFFSAEMSKPLVGGGVCHEPTSFYLFGVALRSFFLVLATHLLAGEVDATLSGAPIALRLSWLCRYYNPLNLSWRYYSMFAYRCVAKQWDTKQLALINHEEHPFMPPLPYVLAETVDRMQVRRLEMAGPFSSQGILTLSAAYQGFLAVQYSISTQGIPYLPNTTVPLAIMGLFRVMVSKWVASKIQVDPYPYPSLLSSSSSSPSSQLNPPSSSPLLHLHHTHPSSTPSPFRLPSPPPSSSSPSAQSTQLPFCTPSSLPSSHPHTYPSPPSSSSCPYTLCPPSSASSSCSYTSRPSSSSSAYMCPSSSSSSSCPYIRSYSCPHALRSSSLSSLSSSTTSSCPYILRSASASYICPSSYTCTFPSSSSSQLSQPYTCTFPSSSSSSYSCPYTTLSFSHSYPSSAASTCPYPPPPPFSSSSSSSSSSVSSQTCGQAHPHASSSSSSAFNEPTDYKSNKFVVGGWIGVLVGLLTLSFLPYKVHAAYQLPQKLLKFSMQLFYQYIAVSESLFHAFLLFQGPRALANRVLFFDHWTFKAQTIGFFCLLTFMLVVAIIDFVKHGFYRACA